MSVSGGSVRVTSIRDQPSLSIRNPENRMSQRPFEMLRTAGAPPSDPPEHQRAVGPAEAERVRHRDIHLLLARGVRHVVQVAARSEEHTSELQSLMRISYAVFCLKTKKQLPQP